MNWRRRMLVLAAGVAIIGCIVFFIRGSVSRTIQTDVLVYGGSLGGASAAITLAENKVATVLVTDTPHVGGQAVEAGLSAFDGQFVWQHSGIYGALEDFLQKKYGAVEHGPIGLGSAIVGNLATLPSDIEEFFLTRIEEEKGSLILLRNYDLTKLKKSWGKLTKAILTSRTNPGEKILVSFKYLVDGTQTGKTYPLAGAPYSFGFDSREETKEPHALPAAVRSAFIEEFGNLAQSVGSPLPIFDKGYRGELFLPHEPARCWTPSHDSPFSKGSAVVTTEDPRCELTFFIQPSFADSYDVFLINQNEEARTITASIQIPGSSSPFLVRARVPPRAENTLYKIVTLPLSGEQLTKITIRSESPWKAEGLIISKKNIHAPPLLMEDLRSSAQTFSMQGFPRMTADILFSTNAANEPDAFSFLLNGHSFRAKRVGSHTYLSEAVEITGSENRIDVGTESGKVRTILVTPTAPLFPAVSLLEITPPVLIPSSPGTPAKEKPFVRTWRFTPSEENRHMLFFDGTNTKPVHVDLLEESSRTSVASVSLSPYQLRTAFGLPAFAKNLRKIPYVLRLSSDEDVRDSTVTLLPLLPPFSFSSGSKEILTPPAEAATVYDLWMRGPRDGKVMIHSDRGSREAVLGKTGDGFTYGGKYLLNQQTSLSVESPEGSEIETVLLPNLNVDTYQSPLHASTQNIDPLPPSLYSVRICPHSSQTKDLSSLTLQESDGEKNTLNMERRGTCFVSANSFLSTGKAATVTFPQKMASGSIIFTETIPKYDGAYAFLLRNHPLLERAPLDARGRPTKTTLFSYRNIVSSKNLFERESPFFPQLPLGRTTAGMAVLLLPSNDLAPVTESVLDDVSLAEKSQERAYALYYWLRYDIPQNKQSLGCSPENDPLCDARRILIAPHVLDSPDGMGDKVYYREGRRLKTLRPIVEQDFSQVILSCKETICDANTCSPYKAGAPTCRAASQPIRLPWDAVGAVQYGSDFHTFWPQEEANTIGDFLREAADKKLLSRDAHVLFNHKILATATALTLGSLVPRGNINLYPASTNAGLSQIANSALRVHYIEMATGTAVGNLIAFSLQNHTEPAAIYADKNLTQAFQKFLVERGVILYPLIDLPLEDPLLVKALQYFMIEGKISPRMDLVAPEEVYFRISPSATLSEEDRKILGTLLPAPTSSATLRDLCKRLVSAKDQSSDQALVFSCPLFDTAKLENPSSSLLSQPLRRKDVLKAAYLLKKTHD